MNKEKLMSFEDVIKSAKKPHLLLGNGFSISYNKDRFSFTSLLESAVSAKIIKKTDNVYKIFQELNTSDFESVMKLLDGTFSVVKTYDKKNKLLEQIKQDSKNLKEYLIKIITNNHPEKSTSLTKKEKENCLIFLSNFNKIYTLNYDLLMYWSIMEAEEDGKYDDGFRNTEKSLTEGYVVYNNLSSKGDINIFYLHGAMHYFDAGYEIIKKTYKHTEICLVDQIRSAFNKNIYPIFISEGTSDQKKTKILHSAYLNHCYKSLRTIHGDIVIFGASLKDNDKHILDAILENKVKNIYFGTTDGSDTSQIEKAIEAHNHKNQKNQKQIYFYDYKTVNIWGH